MSGPRKRKPRSPEEAVTRANRAKRELDMTNEAFEDVKWALLEAIAATPMHDSAGREKLYLSVQVLPLVRSMLEAAVNDGVAAAHSEHLKALLEPQSVN